MSPHQIMVPLIQDNTSQKTKYYMGEAKKQN